ncbi:MAG: asparaginase [Jatrophihabitans sp.]
MTRNDGPIALEVTRGDLVESTHRATVVLLGADGTTAAALGDPEQTVFARSSWKPLQAVALLRAGFSGDSAEVALACASHDGERVHLDTVRAVLEAAGLDESALRCPAALPSGADALAAYLVSGGRPAAVCHNCSGKHAAMVATSVRNGWDLASYLAPEHPIQRAIAIELESRCGAPITFTAVDGCGAPAHALPLRSLAQGFSALTTARDPFATRVVTAMRSHPRLVGGSARAVSDLLAEVDGLIAKDGAEGVWAAALPDGRAFAAKVADGSARALPPLLAAALTYWGFDGPAVRSWSAPAIIGGGEVVGAVRWAPSLRESLGMPR